MSDDLIGKWEISRRRVLAGAAGLGAAGLGMSGLSTGAGAQQGGPWSVAPKSKVDSSTSSSGPMATSTRKIAEQFKARLGRPGRFDHLVVQRSSDQADDHVRGRRDDRRLAVLAVLVPQLHLPGPGRAARRPAGPAKDYVNDFTPFTKQVASIRRQDHGTAVFLGDLGLELLRPTCWRKRSSTSRSATYDELIEHCVKAKKDKVAEYPILWVAGVGLEQLPGTWYQMTWNRGGMFFDKQGNHQLGAGSIARETLKWWAKTFTGRTRRSGIAEGAVHQLGQGVRRRQKPLSRAQPPLRAQHRQRSGAVADRRQGQGARLARATARPSATPTSIS